MNQFDRILKENFRDLSLAVVKETLGLDVATVEELSPRVQWTVELEPDLLLLVTLANRSQYLVHVEWQQKNHPHMHLRMLMYDALLTGKYDLPVLSFMFYVGKAKMNMKNHVTHEQIKYHYILKDIREIDAGALLKSGDPKLVVIAVLAGYSGSRQKLVKSVLRRLKELMRDHHLGLKQKLLQLEILSVMRDEQDLIKKEENMILSEVDWTKDIRYQEGYQACRKKMKQEISDARKEMIQELGAIVVSLSDILPADARAQAEESLSKAINKWGSELCDQAKRRKRSENKNR